MLVLDLVAHAVVSPADVDMLAELLSEVAAHWDLFLGQLGLPQYVRDVIKNHNANMAKFSVRCLLEGLHGWVESEDRPTYGRITAALRGSTVRNEALAQRVEQFAWRQSSGMSNAAVIAGFTVLCVCVCVCVCRKCVAVWSYCSEPQTFCGRQHRLLLLCV